MAVRAREMSRSRALLRMSNGPTSEAIQLKGAEMENDSNDACDGADQFDNGVAMGATICVLMGGLGSIVSLATLASMLIRNHI